MIINVAARFAGRVAARMCRVVLKLAFVGDWISVGRVPGKVDAFLLRTLIGVRYVPRSCAGRCHVYLAWRDDQRR